MSQGDSPPARKTRPFQYCSKKSRRGKSKNESKGGFFWRGAAGACRPLGGGACAFQQFSSK